MYLSKIQAIKLLKEGEVVALPTETVYGLAGLANNLDTIKKIYTIKNRPTDNPLICHFYSYNQIKKYVNQISEAAEILITHFCPGPISFLFDLPNNSSLKSATSGQNSVVCRIPDHPLALQILEEIDVPIAMPSANTSSKFSPTSAKMVRADLGDKIAGVVDGGESIVGLESTIIDCRNPAEIIILRPGSIGKTEIETQLQNSGLKIVVKESPNVDISKVFTTPGSKYKHYSPITPIFEVSDYTQIVETADIAILGNQIQLEKAELFINDTSKIKFINLGTTIEEISHNFYAKLFELDQSKVIKAYLIDLNLDKSSLSTALNDKLKKILQK